MNGPQLKASFHTLGCRLNQAETAMIARRFRERGYQIGNAEQAADILVINSCTVTEQADAKCRRLVRRVLRKRPHTFVAVVGCYAQTGSEALRNIAGVDLIVGTQDKMNVRELFEQAPFKVGAGCPPRIVRSRVGKEPFTIAGDASAGPLTRANLKVQDGCDFMCSFCVIPFARGRARSRAFEDIRREAFQLVAAGHKEIVLTGVNIGTYRFADKTFIDVVRMLASITGLVRLRISSIEPTTISEHLLDLMADSDVICPHLHIPVQSGDDDVLAAMKRGHRRREYERLLERATTRMPDILIGTDLMAGFPGESDAAFRASCDLLRESQLAYAHVFTFSERAGIAAQRLSGKTPAEVKKQRSSELHRLSETKKRGFYQRFIGRKLRVLLEESDGRGHGVGFSDNYLKVAVKQAGLRANTMVETNAVDFDKDHLIGEALAAPAVGKVTA